MDDMKDSGIPWLGEIPTEWKINRLKYVAEILDEYRKPISAEKRNQDAEILYDYYGASGKIDKIDGYTFDGHAMLIGEDGANLLLRTLPLVYEVKGKVWINNHAHIIKPKQEVSFRYLFFELESSDIRTYITGSAQPKLNQENLTNIPVVTPPINEQKSIADFLDKKCGEIDGIVAKIQQEVETLKQYKRSIISEAVTKGIRPNVSMKDSGVEWIKEVPSHWDLRKIKTLFALRNEKNYLPLEEVNLISLYTELGVIQHSDLEKTSGNKAVNADGYKKVYKDDIVVNIILCWMGAIGRSNYNGVTSPAYDVYKPKRGVSSYFFHYYFRTKGFSGDCYKYGKGIMAMRWRTYSSQFLNIMVAVPPLEEQREIAAYLDQKCAAIDAIISSKEEQLQTLASYKKSLIYEYVTGKKRVPTA